MSQVFTGRCYCGHVTVSAQALQTVAYCHCASCRRWTGGPVSAFAAFAPKDLTTDPPLGPPLSTVPGVERWSCPQCGSPIAARFEYLPDQVYVPVGIMDQIDDLAPASHSHFGEKVTWLHMQDGLPREDESARDVLSAAKPS
ncbi:MAG: GFA family protein [Aliishimia sp.]